MDRRTLLAISLSFLIFVAWQKFYIEPRLPHPEQMQQQLQQQPAQAVGVPAAPVAAAQAPSSSLTAPTVPSITSKPEQLLTLATATGDVVLSNGPNLIHQWQLKNYRKGLSEKTETIDLGFVTNQTKEITFAVDDPQYAYLSQVVGTLKPTTSGATWFYEDQNVRLTREINAGPSQYFLDVKMTAEFKAKAPSFAFLSLQAKGQTKDPEEQDRQLHYFTNKTIERLLLNETFTLKEIATPIQYVGAANRYFLFSVLPASTTSPKGLIQPGNPDGGKLSLVYPLVGNVVTLPFRVYFGPKDLEILRGIEPVLDHTIDFGWFTWVAYPLLQLLRWFNKYVANYGIAIILLTLFVKVITYPLTYKSVKSMKEMSRIQPQIQKIREKYADDKEALNREMLTLMRSNGYNPMAGCLPILIQMPIFFALYRVLYGSIELYHAPFALWIMDLSDKDPLYITPILLTVTMYIQQKLTPNTATDPVQAKMIQWMPVIFGVFMLSLPSGLTIYMLTNAIASIAQQIVLNKKLDIQHVRPAVIEVKKA